MKKLLLVLAIASFAACNDAGTGTENTGDSTTTAAPVDSSSIAPAPVDSSSMPADTTKPADSTIKK
jgi:hypothetical protein